MKEVFERWLNETTKEPCENWAIVTNQQHLEKRGIDMQTLNAINARIKDNFILYRYCMKDNEIIKDCFHMKFWCVSINGEIAYKSYLKENDKTDIRIWEKDLIKATGTEIVPHQRYVYRYEEDDELVTQFYIKQEQDRRDKALKELERANKRLELLNKFIKTPSAL